MFLIILKFIKINIDRIIRKYIYLLLKGYEKICGVKY